MGLQAAPAYILKQADGTTDFQHPIELMRQFTDALFGRKSGRIRVSDMAISTPGVGLTLNIGSGALAVHGVENSSQGSYFVWSNGTEAVSFGAPSASRRYDTILVRVADNQYGTIPVAPQAYFDVVAGASGAGAPRADSYFNTGGAGYIPGAWFRLADVIIDPGDTSINIADVFPNWEHVFAPGAELVVLSTNRPAGVDGLKIYEQDTGLRYFWDPNASDWKMSAPYKKVIKIASTTASVTFSAIPRTLRTVKVTIRGRATNAATFINCQIQIGGDTGSNYFGLYRQQNNAGASVLGGTANTSITGPYLPAASTTANVFGASEVVFPGWDSTSGHLSCKFNGGTLTTNTDYVLSDGVGRYSGANTWNSITLFPNGGSWAAGSELVLEGWD